MSKFATEFSEILNVISNDSSIKQGIIELINRENIIGKVLEGNQRLEKFKEILINLVNGDISFEDSIKHVNKNLSRNTSIYKNDNRVFASNWDYRLVSIQLSRFYNQYILEYLISIGSEKCFVPHSTVEDPNSKCSLQAGMEHNTNVLYTNLIELYSKGISINNLKIPNHPHCTHVVLPIEYKN